MKHSQRVTRLLQKVAALVGGKDENDYNHKVTEAKQKQHLFFVRNKDIDEPHWSPVLGHVIRDLIRDDLYDVEYVGLHRDYLPEGVQPSTKEQKEVRKKMTKFLKRQEADIAFGRKMKNERDGIFEQEAGEEDESSAEDVEKEDKD